MITAKLILLLVTHFICIVYSVVHSQDITLTTMKQHYNLDKEKAWFSLQNLTNDTVYYQVALEVFKNGTLVRRKDDIYNLRSTKITKLNNYSTLEPRQQLSKEHSGEMLDKESLPGIISMLGFKSTGDYDFRFKVVYGKYKYTLIRTLYSSVFKIDDCPTQHNLIMQLPDSVRQNMPLDILSLPLDHQKLIKNTEWYCQDFRNNRHINMSESFANCMNNQLTGNFEKQTGIHVSKIVGLNGPEPEKPGFPQQFTFMTGRTSRYKAVIYSNNKWNNVTIAWKSGSGKIYSMSDTIIHCNDLEFWLEGIDSATYSRQLFPNPKLPFQLDSLSYELIVHRLNMDMEITLWPKKDTDYEKLLVKVYDFINIYNTKSEEKDREYGVVHNAHGRLDNNQLILQIDTGSAGEWFLKPFLKFLSETNDLHKVEVGESVSSGQLLR